MLRSQFLVGAGGSTVVAQLAPITPTVVIGLVAPFSGEAKNIGDLLALGVRGAIRDANELRGPLDRAFALRQFDDQNTIASALLQASFATGDSTIVATIGHVSSDATLQAIPTYANAQMPLVVPLSTDDRLTETNYRNVFRLPTKDATEGALFAQAVLAQYHPKTPFVFVQNADYGAGVANGFLAAMSARKVSALYDQFPYRNADFGSVVDKGLAAKPDYVFLAGIVGDMGPIVAVLRAKGYSGPLGASQGFFDAATVRIGAPAEGMLISSSMPYLALAPSTVRIRSAFQAHYGPMQPISAFGYASAQVVIAAVQRSNATARNTVLSAIAQGIPFSTLVGNDTFLPSGDVLDPEIYFYTIRNGAFVYVHQAHPSTFMLK